MRSPYRVDRVRESLLRELSDIVAHLKDPRIGMVTVVDTEISQDLRYATMFVSVIGTDAEKEDATEALHQALGFIRREVGKRVPLKYTPEIRVKYDDTAERAAHLNTLIDSVTKDDTKPPDG